LGDEGGVLDVGVGVVLMKVVKGGVDRGTMLGMKTVTLHVRLQGAGEPK